MRRKLWPLTLLVAAGAAQWRHFGVSAPSPSLSAEMVAAHNAVRARVGVGPLTWSDPLASVAQEWADGLIKSGQLVHSGNPKYGENLYEIEGGAATSASVVDWWAGEVKDYNYDSNSCRGVCGHYTQIVWKETREVGCAMARGQNRREVWVCEYDPPGNFVGKKPY
jgi:uncharacterized protein YkwD